MENNIDNNNEDVLRCERGRPTKYHTNNDRLKAKQAQKNSYAKKRWTCHTCDMEMFLGNKANHLKTNSHSRIKERRKECPTCSESD